jgi:hypothetical protein
MVLASKEKEDFWSSLTIANKDLDFIYNKLFELETPLKTIDLVKLLINEIIEKEKVKQKKLERLKGNIYLPKDDYQVGQKITFPNYSLTDGVVISKYPGNNPEIGNFSVIEVEFSTGEKKLFASQLEEHKLNNSIANEAELDRFDFDKVILNHRKYISNLLLEQLEKNEDLVQIAGYWFPRSLLVDINMGYLNLAEAVLEMENGGPLSTASILEQIELPSDANPLLTEFSLNYALQEDERFDEVGPSGETLWFLNRLEPDSVRNTPVYLLAEAQPKTSKHETWQGLSQLNAEVFDDLEVTQQLDGCISDVTISIIYPHWRSGTLPLSECLENLFPTAYEAPRIRFTFVDGQTGEKFAGWVIRKNRYVYGLSDWYKKNEVVPGSRLHIKQGKNPGEMIISIGKKRPTREWVRTADVNPEGKIAFKMLKQQVSTEFDERMIVVISNPREFDLLWQKYSSYPTEKLLPIIFRELAKMNPQGHVHAQELYSAFNCVRRISPSYTLSLLDTNEEIEHLGDMYFRIKN